MKQLVVAFIFLSTIVNSANSQAVYDKWSLETHFGLSSAMGPFANGYSSNFLTFAHFDVGTRYMLTNKFGLKWDVSFDRIKDDEMGGNKSNFNGVASLPFETHYFRTTLHMVFDVGRVFEFEKIHENFSMLMNLGYGFSSLKSKSNSVWLKDWKTQGTDEMANLCVGLSPQLRINDNFSLNLNLAMTYNYWQSMTFDYTQKVDRKDPTGKIFSVSAGFCFYLGKNMKHLDWVYLPGGSGTYVGADTIHKIETIRTIETIKVRGQEVEGVYKMNDDGPDDDFDKDGVKNDVDACPTLRGDLANGCPAHDQDGDGIRNEVDECPELAGILSNKGCPGIDLPVKVILNDAMTNVNFDKASAVLVEGSHKYIDAVVNVLIEHPEYFIELQGHTDNFGEQAPLLSLSQKRAQVVKDYMVLKGIDKSRISAIGFGPSKPIASNEHPAGREQNDRIDFKITFK